MPRFVHMNLLLLYGILTGCAMHNRLDITTIETPEHVKVLTTPAETVTFPLSPETKAFIQNLKDKVMELDAAGLAAPQVGWNVRIIAYQVSEIALKYRDDVEDLVPLSILINPSYEVIDGHERTLDWEGCYSVTSSYGKVWRATKIKYQGYDEHGNRVEGIAKGFLARLLQHEIDHTEGKLCKDKYPEGGFYGEFEAMKAIRMKEIEQKNQKTS